MTVPSLGLLIVITLISGIVVIIIIVIVMNVVLYGHGLVLTEFSRLLTTVQFRNFTANVISCG